MMSGTGREGNSLDGQCRALWQSGGWSCCVSRIMLSDSHGMAFEVQVSGNWM